MQQDFDAQGLPIQIVGINEVGFEVGNEYITEDRHLPWLQDTEAVNAWDTWSITYRDVHILDADHNLRYIFNLTTHDLQEAQHYEHFQEAVLGLVSE